MRLNGDEPNIKGDKIDTWCGKAYKAGDPAIDPGGRIELPVPSNVTLLDLKIQQRHLPYLASDSKGSFIIDTTLSYIHGEPFTVPLHGQTKPVTFHQNDSILGLGSNESQLTIQITRTDSDAQIASGDVALNVSDAEVEFSLDTFKPSEKPYGVRLQVLGLDSQSYEAETQLLRLPNPPEGRTVTKIDALYGSLIVYENNRWEPFLPYSFYTASWAANPEQLSDFAKNGYNVLHVIPSYDYDWFDKVADEAERLGLWIMYDLRGTWQDHPKVIEQVKRYANRKKLLLWYTADEPDGNVDPQDAPKKVYDIIKSLDPYHPISLCLNCANYFFEPYSTGADILLSDVYPISTNTTFSSRWHTECNSTYGCCGCDDCAGVNDLTNVPTRLDQMRLFQTQLGRPQKPLWGVPQAFGHSEYWTRAPTKDEEAAMTMLSINHGAKGIVMWTWPTTPELVQVTASLAKALVEECTRWILGAKLVQGLRVNRAGEPEAEGLDVSAWVGKEGELLLSVVNPVHDDLTGDLTVELLPGLTVSGVGQASWGTSWSVSGSGRSTLTRKGGMPGLGVDLFTVKFEGRLSMTTGLDTVMTS